MWNTTSIGLLVIRIGLAGVLLWFGAQQLLDPAMWTGYIPEWVLSLTGFGAQTFVLMNGSAEIATGLLLLLGVFTRFVALVMGLHMVFIALSLGNTPSGIRDWGLAFALLGLALTGGGLFSFDDRARSPRSLSPSPTPEGRDE